MSADWQRLPLGRLVTVMGGGTPRKEQVHYWDGGTIPWVSPKDMKVSVLSTSEDHITPKALRESAVRVVPERSVLIVVRGMILAREVPLALNSVPVTLNQDMKALVPREGIDAAFLRYSLLGHHSTLFALIEEAGHGTRCLRSDLLFRLQLSVPSLSEQRRIADFLDERCAAIDAAIEKKERMVKCDHERWRSLLRAC